MFVVRSAQPEDTDALAAVIRARALWMRGWGLEDWDAWLGSADLLAARAVRPGSRARLLVHDSGAVVGCTTLSETPSDDGWNPGERAEAALYLSTTCTDPAWRDQRPGSLLVSWALGRAAQEGRSWLRRSCRGDGLLRHYRDVQGFTLVRSLPDDGGTTHLLAARPGRAVTV